ncbi:perlucin-like, partial [Mizuhopecten yessoensis]|uniref:perlucin-like n=1 Tax=Mizuhopecten yessoensis TaxID=6573 RepID=UPI000B45BCA5
FQFHCNILHASLADIFDERENNFIKSQLHLKHAHGCYYMSATDIVVEGQWIWPKTEDPVEYMDWGPTEPQNAGAGEDCVCLSEGVDFRWVDVPCHSLRHFICKKRSDAGIGHEIIG